MSLHAEMRHAEMRDLSQIVKHAPPELALQFVPTESVDFLFIEKTCFDSTTSCDGDERGAHAVLMWPMWPIRQI